MNVDLKTPLLGGLSPQAFMRRHWQKKPLLVRQAMPGVQPVVSRAALFALAARDDVESRLVVRERGRWSLRSGPLPRRALPPLTQKHWSLLVQGLDLHVDAAHELLARFRFVADARLDDVMVSYASDGGGVGAHVDSYDVFLLQVLGRRRWRYGRNVAPALDAGAPLKLLKRFVPEHDCLLEPGDMLYLPPGWAHDGVARGECMTCSIGFQAPRREELAQQLLQRLADANEHGDPDPMYRDGAEPATAAPGAIPARLSAFALQALQRKLADPQLVACALGEVLSEPKPRVVFTACEAAPLSGDLRLDRRTRMMYDRGFVFINGESFRAAGRDARLMRRLADARVLTASEWRALSAGASGLLREWAAAGWLHGDDPGLGEDLR
jgi:50S ribosomal protein L16 3-hydroxylase